MYITTNILDADFVYPKNILFDTYDHKNNKYGDVRSVGHILMKTPFLQLPLTLHPTHTPKTKKNKPQKEKINQTLTVTCTLYNVYYRLILT